MEVLITHYKRCEVLSIIGRVDSSTAPQLQEETAILTKDGKYKIVFDLGKVEFLSSAGLRILIVTQKECKRYNRERCCWQTFLRKSILRSTWRDSPPFLKSIKALWMR